MEPMTEEHEAKPATPEELKALKRRCWRPDCKRRAFLRDWTGWKWCWRDWLRSLRWGSGENNKWFFIRTTRIF